MLSAVYYAADDELDFYDGETNLINDLEGYPVVPVASGSNLATSSNAGPVTLDTIHQDIQLLNYTVLFIFLFCFILFLSRRSR